MRSTFSPALFRVAGDVRHEQNGREGGEQVIQGAGASSWTQIHPDACPTPRHVRADGPESHDAEGLSLEIALDRAGDVHILRM